MGKSAFGRRALMLLKEYVARNPNCRQLSSVPNAELLKNSLHITIDCSDDYVAIDCSDDSVVPDLDQASVWIAFQLLLCSGLLKPSAISALRSMKKEDAARLSCYTGDVIRWLAEQQRGKTKTPLMIVVHMDDYHRLISRTSEKFVREVLYDMISQFYATPSTGIIVAVLLTSTVKPMLFPINQAVPNEVPLDPLDPDVVLNHLLVKYVDHPLFADAADLHSDARRRWLGFLHDIGVIPIFLTLISDQLDNPDHSLFSLSSISSMIGAYAKNQCSKLVDHVEFSREMIRSALSRRPIDLQKEDRWQLFQTFRDEGLILLDASFIAFERNVVRVPLVFLHQLLPSAKYASLVEFPLPADGVPFDKMVFLTLLARLEYCLPFWTSSFRLLDAFSGIMLLQKNQPPKSLRLESFHDIAEGDMWIPIPAVAPVLQPDPLSLEDVSPSTLHLGNIYQTPKRDLVIDAFLCFNFSHSSRSPSFLWILLKIQGCQMPAAKHDMDGYISAIRRLKKFQDEHPNDHAVLVFISQQKLPESLHAHRLRSFPADNTIFVIAPEAGLENFALPGMFHRFQPSFDPTDGPAMSSSSQSVVHVKRSTPEKKKHQHRNSKRARRH